MTTNTTLIDAAAFAVEKVMVNSTVDTIEEFSVISMLMHDAMFFVAGFVVLRMSFITGVTPSKLRLGWLAPPPAAQSAAVRKVVMAAAPDPKSRTAEALCAAAASGYPEKVLAAWDSEDASCRTPLTQEALRMLAHAFARVAPERAVPELAACVAKHGQELGSGRWAPHGALEGVCRAGRPDLAESLADEMGIQIDSDGRACEMLLGALAAQGDVGAVEKLLPRLPAASWQRGAGTVLRGLARGGLAVAAGGGARRLLRVLGAKVTETPLPGKAVAELVQAALAQSSEVLEEILSVLEESKVPLPAECVAPLASSTSLGKDLAGALRLEGLVRAGQSGSLSSSAVYDPLLKLYAQFNGERASDLLKEMQQQGIVASEGFFGSLLARCSESKNLAFAEQIADYLRARSVMSLALYKTLMKVYASCEQYEKACDLYSELQEAGIQPDQVMYGCLVKFAVKSGRKELSQELLERSSGTGVSAVQSYMHMIRAAGRDGDVDRAFGLLQKLKEEQPALLDTPVYNIVLDACMTNGDKNRGSQLMRDMRSQGVANSVTYNTMIKGLLAQGDCVAARRCLDAMKKDGFKPDSASFNSFLSAAVSANHFTDVWALVSEMDDDGVRLDQYSVSILMKAARRASNPRDADKALAILDRRYVRVCEDEVLFNTAVDALVRRRDLRRLERVMSEFKTSDLKPSVQSCGLIIRALGALKDLEGCWKLWKQMVEQRGLTPDEVTLSCMLDALVSGGSVASAVDLFREWKGHVTPNTVMYSTLLKGFASNGEPQKAMDTYEEMKAAGLPMNLVSYSTLIDAQARAGNLDLAVKLLKKMEDDGCTPNCITISALVKGYCMKGDLGSAFGLFRDLHARGLAPDIVLMNMLLDGCVHHNRFKLADQLIGEIPQYGLESTSATISIMVKLWGKRRRLDMAFEAVRTHLARTPMSRLDAKVGACVISACLFNRDPDRAMEALREIKAQPRWEGPDAGAYAALAAGLASHGRAREAAKVVEEAQQLSSGPQPTIKPLPADVVGQVRTALARAGLEEELGSCLPLKRSGGSHRPPPSRSDGGGGGHHARA